MGKRIGVAIKRAAAKVAKDRAALKAPPAVVGSAAARAQIEGTTALSRRVAKVKNTGDLPTFFARVAERNALVRLIDRLEGDRALAPLVWQSVETGLIAVPTGPDATADEYFHEAVPNVGSLPIEWMAKFLHSASNGALSQQVLDRIDGACSHSIQYMFYFATKTGPKVVVPKGMAHKATCWANCMRRYEAVGNRLVGFEAFISPTGVINWWKVGPYRPAWDGEFMRSIAHIQGATVDPLPAHVVVTREFALEDPWLDLDARLTLGSTAHSLHQLFPAGAAPNDEALPKWKLCLDELFKTPAAAPTGGEAGHAAEPAASASSSNAPPAVDEASFLTQHETQKNAKRRAALEDARKKLADGAKRRRSLTFQPSST